MSPLQLFAVFTFPRNSLLLFSSHSPPLLYYTSHLPHALPSLFFPPKLFSFPSSHYLQPSPIYVGFCISLENCRHIQVPVQLRGFYFTRPRWINWKTGTCNWNPENVLYMLIVKQQVLEGGLKKKYCVSAWYLLFQTGGECVPLSLRLVCSQVKWCYFIYIFWFCFQFIMRSSSLHSQVLYIFFFPFP